MLSGYSFCIKRPRMDKGISAGKVHEFIIFFIFLTFIEVRGQKSKTRKSDAIVIVRDSQSRFADEKTLHHYLPHFRLSSANTPRTETSLPTNSRPPSISLPPYLPSFSLYPFFSSPVSPFSLYSPAPPPHPLAVSLSVA